EDLQKSEISDSASMASIQTMLKTTDSVLTYSGTKIINLPGEQPAFTRIIKINATGFFGFQSPDILEFTRDGRINNKILFSGLPLHEKFKAIAKPLHTGEVFGLPGIIVYFLACLTGCSLPVTGIIIWWKRNVKSKKKKQRYKKCLAC